MFIIIKYVSGNTDSLNIDGMKFLANVEYAFSDDKLLPRSYTDLRKLSGSITGLFIDKSVKHSEDAIINMDEPVVDSIDDAFNDTPPSLEASRGGADRVLAKDADVSDVESNSAIRGGSAIALKRS